jgi:hypothetical protein
VTADPFRGPWFNSETAARYTDKPTRRAFRMWATRKGIVATSEGRLYSKADIDRVLRDGAQRTSLQLVSR